MYYPKHPFFFKGETSTESPTDSDVTIGTFNLTSVVHNKFMSVTASDAKMVKAFEYKFSIIQHNLTA